MDWQQNISDLNWVAVLVATLSSFAVGYVWYHWSVFGEKWAKLVGMSKKEMDSSDGMGKVFLMTGIQAFVSCVALGALLLATSTEGWTSGLVFGAVLGFAFRFGSHVMHNGFAHRSNDLTWIDGAHDVVAMAVAGAILGAWL
jgi:sterol desaturase/sphingolipid hydroxylase (fatty acid hydroxylase superfamily)